MVLFQATLPVWGATGVSTDYLLGRDISIHAPRVGSDAGHYQVVSLNGISIHAPRVGSDSTRTRFVSKGTISIHAPRVGSD